MLNFVLFLSMLHCLIWMIPHLFLVFMMDMEVQAVLIIFWGFIIL